MPKAVKIILVALLAAAAVLSGTGLLFKLAAAAGAVLLISAVVSRGYFRKIYFFLLTVVWILGITGIIETGESRVPVILAYLDYIMTPLSLLGLFGYTFKKKIFNKTFWQVFFFVYIAHFTAAAFFSIDYNTYKDSEMPGVENIIAPLVITGIGLLFYPLFLGLYRYGFDGEEKEERILNVLKKHSQQ